MTEERRGGLNGWQGYDIRNNSSKEAKPDSTEAYTKNPNQPNKKPAHCKWKHFYSLSIFISWSKAVNLLFEINADEPLHQKEKKKT